MRGLGRKGHRLNFVKETKQNKTKQNKTKQHCGDAASFSSHLVSQSEDSVKTYESLTGKRPHTQLCETKLGGKHLSPNIWSH